MIGSCPAENPIVVTVSIPPQKYFVEKIGGERVSVRVMASSGVFAHTFEPKPQQMASLRESRIYFAIGVSFEKAWLPRFRSANSSLQFVETQKGIEKIPMQGRHSHEEGKHDHEEDGKEQGELDPHIWLSPALVKIQAKNILDALIQTDPTGGDHYRKNHDSFIVEVNSLDEHIRKTLEGKKGASFLVFHPAWGYFAKDYGLNQIPVEIEGKNPGPRDMKSIMDIAREKGIRHIFVQPQISPRLAEVIARSIGGEAVVADPLAENWRQNLKEVAEKFKTRTK
ncbi:zinc ABC transporter substrate-binding protein [Candidatus Sumerlaeota bacterium]|nr:zinc ABC transporter substrate-binding protein [Candidatus Sumerlaeota bacterium]